jgi:hypothetical protein
MPLTPHGRAAEQAVHETNVGHVIELVGSYGLSTGDRMSLAQELHHRAVTVRDEHLDVRKIADVWREGLTRRRPPEPSWW